jgi:hypothetical protein
MFTRRKLLGNQLAGAIPRPRDAASPRLAPASPDPAAAGSAPPLASLSPPTGSFEDEHDDQDDASAEALAKEDLVADFGVRRRRAHSSRSVERYALCPLCLCGEIPPFLVGNARKTLTSP